MQRNLLVGLLYRFAYDPAQLKGVEQLVHAVQSQFSFPVVDHCLSSFAWLSFFGAVQPMLAVSWEALGFRIEYTNFN
jgi:hypothetical protein